MSTLYRSIFLLLITFLPASTSAATIYFEASPTQVGVGDTVAVTVLLESGIPTNAFSGSLVYPPELVPVAVVDGSSIINLWVTHPALSTGRAPITFAGITPGGFSGSKGKLFTILFRAESRGVANVSLADAQVLRNDGEGSAEPTTVRALSLSIGPVPSGGYVEPSDTTPPESFTTYLSSDPELFGGQHYLAFTAVDKGSGVDQYLVAETRLPFFLFNLLGSPWRVATTSPQLLGDQNLTSTIYVKAIDRFGNERMSIVVRPRLLSSYEMVLALGILLGVALVVLRRKWRTKNVA